MMFADDAVICGEGREHAEKKNWREGGKKALQRRGMEVSGSKM